MSVLKYLGIGYAWSFVQTVANGWTKLHPHSGVCHAHIGPWICVSCSEMNTVAHVSPMHTRHRNPARHLIMVLNVVLINQAVTEAERHGRNS